MSNETTDLRSYKKKEEKLRKVTKLSHKSKEGQKNNNKNENIGFYKRIYCSNSRNQGLGRKVTEE